MLRWQASCLTVSNLTFSLRVREFDSSTGGYNFVKKGVQRVREVMSGIRSHASPSVRSWLEKYGDDVITDMKIWQINLSFP